MPVLDLDATDPVAVLKKMYLHVIELDVQGDLEFLGLFKNNTSIVISC
jgi:hypothetical protein